MKPQGLLIAIVLFSLPAVPACAATVTELVDALGDDHRRPAAIDKLLDLGANAEAELRKLEATNTLEPRQQLIVRRLLGELQIKQSPLSPLDLSKLAPWGENKERHEAGNPNILIHPGKRLVVLDGEFTIAYGLLEYLVASFKPDTKLHESIVGVRATAGEISAAMITREFGWSGEIDDDGKVSLPKDTGVTISVEFEWETPHAAMNVCKPGETIESLSEKTKWVRVPIEYFAWNVQTKKPMKCIPFAFNGSTYREARNGKRVFMADVEGSVVAAKLDPCAVMNSPLDTHSINPRNGESGYWINPCIVPRPGSKCRVVLEQYTGAELTDADLKDTVAASEKSGK